MEGSGRERALDLMLGAAIWAARRLPYTQRIPAAGSLARFAFERVGRFRERIDANLDYIWPDLAKEQREEIARQVADNAGRVLIEHFSLEELKQRIDGRHPTGEGVQPVMDAAARGQPIVWVSGHLGNHEAAWLCLQNLGLSIGGLYRPLSNPHINRRYVRAMDSVASGVMFAQDRGGIVNLARHLKSGGSAALLCDLYAGNGIEMDFLGRPALTALTAAQFAERSGALLVPFYGIRRENGLDFEVVVEKPIPSTEPVAMMRAFHASLESRIAENPGQWMWMHRRWKRKWNRGKGMNVSLHPAQLPRRKSR